MTDKIAYILTQYVLIHHNGNDEEGIVVGIVPPMRDPRRYLSPILTWANGSGRPVLRDHISYLVLVRNGRVRWPRVASLRAAP